jgi:tetratricopeptide (TPR) repeat protein
MFLANHDRDLETALSEAETTYKTFRNIKVEDTLAWCYYKLGNFKKARLMIERAMKFHTPDPHMYFHRGMIYLKLGDAATAAAHLKTALSLNPDFHPVDAPLAKEALAGIDAVQKKAQK